MIDEQTILGAERLRDNLSEFLRELRARYGSADRQVALTEHRTEAAQLAERWLVELANDQALGVAIGSATLADLNVHFQRILTFSEHATTRARYDLELRSILNDYGNRVIVPLKQSRGRRVGVVAAHVQLPVHSAFVGQSFFPGDKRVNDCIAGTLDALGVKVVTGEKPKADLISSKVKTLIEGQSIFVGVFTRRDKIARKLEWTTSSWVIDEKAYALGRSKRLILLKEQGVGSIGGIQGDYEYIEFSRDSLENLAVRVIQLFDLTNKGMR